MGKAFIFDRVFQHLYIPRISGAGHLGAIVVIDPLSKFSFVDQIKRFTANVLTEYLDQKMFHGFGIPEAITSDNGLQFNIVAFNDLLDQHICSTLYFSQANAS